MLETALCRRPGNTTSSTVVHRQPQEDTKVKLHRLLLEHAQPAAISFHRAVEARDLEQRVAASS